MTENISGISYLDNIDLMPVSTGLSLRSKKEILDRLLIDYVVASIATYAFCSSFDLIKTFLTTLDNKFDISRIISGKDKDLIIQIYNNQLSKEELQKVTYRFESANVCMWVLGFASSITYKNKCSVKAINELLLGANQYNDILGKCVVRNVDEIIEYYSVISKVIYSNNKMDEVTNNIISSQDDSFRYIVLYNFNKSGLKARYSNGDLKFEFELPGELKFENLSSNILFALKGKDNLRILAQEVIGERIQDNLKKLMSSGFEVLDVNYVRSLYIEKRIVKVNLKKKDILVNTYYLFIDDHLIRIDFSVSKRNIESDIVYSLKIFE